MKHAGPEALDSLEDVLSAVRRHDGPRERGRGIFYLRSDAFLHFHEDPAGPFADLKVEGRWVRLRVATKRERVKLLREVARALPTR
jgi:hypothetical protein